MRSLNGTLFFGSTTAFSRLIEDLAFSNCIELREVNLRVVMINDRMKKIGRHFLNANHYQALQFRLLLLK